MEKSQIVEDGPVQRVSEVSFQKLNIEIDEIQQNIINTTISSWSPKKKHQKDWHPSLRGHGNHHNIPYYHHGALPAWKRNQGV